MIDLPHMFYERLTAAIACGIRDGLRLAREEKREEERSAELTSLSPPRIVECDR